MFFLIFQSGTERRNCTLGVGSQLAKCLGSSSTHEVLLIFLECFDQIRDGGTGLGGPVTIGPIVALEVCSTTWQRQQRYRHGHQWKKTICHDKGSLSG